MGVLLGKDAANDYVARFAREGVNPLSASAADIVFDSNSSFVRIFQSGSVEIPQGNTSTPGTVTITFPDQGVLPAALFAVYRLQGFDYNQPYVAQYGQGPNVSASAVRVAVPSTFQLTSSSTRIQGVDAEVTQTQMTVRNWYFKYLANPVRTQPFICNYFLFIP